MKELCSLNELTGYALHATDGDVGHLEQVYFDDQSWQVRYLVASTGGWLLGREVLLLPGMVQKFDHEEQRIDLNITREQIQQAPPVDEHKPVSRYYEEAYFQHYDWEPYWDLDPLLGGFPVTPPPGKPAAEPPAEPKEPHLRSSAELLGYDIHTASGDVGAIVDLVLEVPGWTLRYVQVKTGTWLVGKKRLIACAWLDDIDWSAREVSTVLSRESIERAPAYDPGRLINREYEIALYKHYGRDYERGDGAASS